MWERLLQTATGVVVLVEFEIVKREARQGGGDAVVGARLGERLDPRSYQPPRLIEVVAGLCHLAHREAGERGVAGCARMSDGLFGQRERFGILRVDVVLVAQAQ